MPHTELIDVTQKIHTSLTHTHTHTPIGNVPVFEAENGLSGALSKFSSENGIGH